jgi:hypothetical protein
VTIETLIDKFDTFELVRDQIAAILVVESAAQMVLAANAVPTPKDPNLWKLRVFTERSNPWSHFIDDSPADTSPIVNVSFDGATYDMSKSNVVERQHSVGIFHIDCLGYGKSADVVAGGHQPGDELAAFEAQRALRLVRNILMAGTYTYLGMQKVVGRRWPQSVNIFQPQDDGHHMQNVVAARLALQVEFNEFSPQVQGQIIELISLRVLRAETGQLLLRTDYPIPPPPP